MCVCVCASSSIAAAAAVAVEGLCVLFSEGDISLIIIIIISDI